MELLNRGIIYTEINKNQEPFIITDIRKTKRQKDIQRVESLLFLGNIKEKRKNMSNY